MPQCLHQASYLDRWVLDIAKAVCAVDKVRDPGLGQACERDVGSLCNWHLHSSMAVSFRAGACLERGAHARESMAHLGLGGQG